MNPYPHIFTPVTLKKTTFKNRIFGAPATVNLLARDGAPTAEAIETYESRARGGFAQVTVTETFIDFEYAARYGHGLDLVTPELSTGQIESFYFLTEAIRSHGAVASIQLNHVGGVNHPNALGGKNPIGPSRMVRPDGVEIDEMDEEMIHRVAGNYAAAVGSAKALGFDMAMIHGGHGWLLSQFTSPLSNKRTDQWGGSLENRARFACLVLDKVREEVGPDFVIEYRISGDERVEGGMGLAETIDFCRIIEEKVDLLHVTAGIYHSHVETKAFSSMFDPHGCNVDLAAAVKAAVNVPVVSVGGYNDPALAEQVIAEGKCDFVALGRQQLADPAWVNKALTGRTDEISPCLRCSCFNPMTPDPEKRVLPRPWACTVNPTLGRELRLRWQPQPNGRRKVLVVGGGVSGMYAAITAAERGHYVKLCEKEAKLGGWLWFTDYDHHKEDLRKYRDALAARVERLGVEVRLNSEVTWEDIETMNPDAVICAVGSEPFVPPIPGIENAASIFTAFSDADAMGEKIVIVGGGLVGCEIGYYLAGQGKSVHIVEMQDDVAKDALDSHRRALLPRMEKCLTWDVSTRCVSVAPGKITVSGPDGTEREIEADTIFYAAGLKPKTEVVDALRGAVNWFVPVGDCVRPRRVKEAVYEGMMAAMDVV